MESWTRSSRRDSHGLYLATGKRKASNTDLSKIAINDEEARLNKLTSADKRRAWLNSSPSWKAGKLDNTWTGVKVLGIGGNGIAALLEKTAADGIDDTPVGDKIVVKQIGSDAGAVEAKLMLGMSQGSNM